MVWQVRTGAYDAVILVDDLNLALAAVAPLVLTLLPGGPVLAAVCHEPRPRNRWAGGGLFASSRSLLGLLRRLYPRLDVVFVHGDRSRQEFARVWPPARIAVIPHGDERIVAGAPPPPSGEERVLFFGDWRRAKGLHDLMAAFERLEPRRPAARLTIAGTPSPDGEPERVRAWAAERPERVEVIDRYVPLEDVRDVFARARVVVTPYLAGSQSGVLHLAMTMERAAVTSDVGELGRTVVDGETGRVIPSGDVEALADALVALLGDPELCARLGAEARRRLFAESGWERVAERVEAELQQVRLLKTGVDHPQVARPVDTGAEVAHVVAAVGGPVVLHARTSPARPRRRSWCRWSRTRTGRPTAAAGVAHVHPVLRHRAQDRLLPRAGRAARRSASGDIASWKRAPIGGASAFGWPIAEQAAARSCAPGRRSARVAAARP